MTDAEDVFRFPGCRGRLWQGAASWDIEFDLTYSAEGSIELNCSHLPLTAESIKLKKVYRGDSGEVEELRLHAHDQASNVVTSESVYLTRCNTASDESGSRLEVKASALRIDIAFTGSPEPGSGTNIRTQAAFHTQGQRGFRAVEHPSPLGKVLVGGEPRPTDYSRMTGIVAVQNDAVPAVGLAAWGDECERMVDSLLDIFSLGEGRFFRWCVKKVCAGEDIYRLSLVAGGTTDAPYRPVFEPLNLQPVLELALEKYTAELRERAGLRVALQWFLVASTYTEVRYVAMMTALEHLVHAYMQGRSSSILEQRSHRTLLSKNLLGAIGQTIASLQRAGRLAEEDAAAAAVLLNNGLGNLQRRPLKRTLREMLADYGVPLTNLEEHLDSMVDARNDIVHRGLYEGRKHANPSLTFYEDVLAELLKRTFLSLLEFQGHYNSWLRGHERVEFSAKHAPRLPVPRGILSSPR